MIFPFGKYKNEDVNVVFNYYRDYEYLSWWVKTITNKPLPIEIVDFLNKIESTDPYDWKYGNPDMRMSNYNPEITEDLYDNHSNIDFDYSYYHSIIDNYFIKNFY
jgi:hypothetical protein